MTDLLKSVVSRGIAGNAAIAGVEVGGKTGTTNDTFDVWFDGFTPDFAAALWIGTDLNVEMNGSSAQAAALWSRIMRQVNGITEGEYLEMPSNVIKANGEYYTNGTEKNAGVYTGGSSNKDDKKEKAEEKKSDDADEPKDDSGSKDNPPADDQGGGDQGDGDQGGGDQGGGDQGGGDQGGGDQGGGGDSGGDQGGGDSGGGDQGSDSEEAPAE
jgi:penicillin-binding protein 1A